MFRKNLIELNKTTEHRNYVGAINKIKMKKLWQDPIYRKHMSDVHKGNPGFWTGKNRLHMWDEKHPNWRGDKVGKVALHSWVKRRLGKPNHCEYCGNENAKKYEWANKSRKYFRVLTDWIRLCTRCHYLYDSKKLNEVNQYAF